MRFYFKKMDVNIVNETNDNTRCGYDIYIIYKLKKKKTHSKINSFLAQL